MPGDTKRPMTSSSATHLDPRRERLARVRGRNREVLRVLITHHKLSYEQLAEEIQIGLENFKKRVTKLYAVLGVEDRLDLYATYHDLISELDAPK